VSKAEADSIERRARAQLLLDELHGMVVKDTLTKVLCRCTQLDNARKKFRNQVKREKSLHDELKLMPSAQRRARLLEVAREQHLSPPQLMMYNQNRLDFERVPQPPRDMLTEWWYNTLIVTYVMVTTGVVANFGATAYPPIVHAKWAEAVIGSIVLVYLICIPVKITWLNTIVPKKLVPLLQEIEKEPSYMKYKRALKEGMNLKLAIKAAVRGDEEANAGGLTGADALRAAILAAQTNGDDETDALNITLAQVQTTNKQHRLTSSPTILYAIVQLAAQRKGGGKGAKAMLGRLTMLGGGAANAAAHSVLVKDIKEVS
jgi:hypothetical protein